MMSLGFIAVRRLTALSYRSLQTRHRVSRSPWFGRQPVKRLFDRLHDTSELSIVAIILKLNVRGLLEAISPRRGRLGNVSSRCIVTVSSTRCKVKARDTSHRARRLPKR